MRYELRSPKRGESYYSFVYYQKGKRIRLSKKQIQNRFGKDITTEREAKHCLGMLEAEFDSEKKMLQRVKKWKEEFYHFETLLKGYTLKQKKKAPNSYKNNCHNLEHYVLSWFLSEERKISNINLWPSHYEVFKDDLEQKKLSIRNRKPLSYATKNHVIKALNTFMRHLYNDGILSELRLATPFEEHLLNERTAEDIISEAEMESIERILHEEGHKLEADFLRFLYFTGMRINEGVGISLVDVHPGETSKRLLKKLLGKNDISYFGYVILMSQPAGDNRTTRDPKSLTVPRKPLKGRKNI